MRNNKNTYKDYLAQVYNIPDLTMHRDGIRHKSNFPVIHTIEKFAWYNGKKINTHLYKNHDAVEEIHALQRISGKLKSKMIARILLE